MSTATTTPMFIFRELELNQRMRRFMKVGEDRLFAYIRRTLGNHVLMGEAAFYAVLDDIRAQITRINEKRTGRGHYLHVDGALPTDITPGWISVTYLDVRRARASIQLVRLMGNVGITEQPS